MIKNPHIKFFLYDPYSKKLTHEAYEHESMHQIRYAEIERARSA